VYTLGIDGGGTKTVCVASRGDLSVAGRGISGPSNYLKEGLHTARTSLRDAIGKALEEAGGNRLEVQVACAGLAGVGRVNERMVMKRLFTDLLPNARVILETDAFITLIGATHYQPGLIVISGTGSIALGLNEVGETARAGGWGHILGDEGSGYDIARRGLMAALHAHDGRGPETLIKAKLIEQFYLASIDELISLLYGEATPSRIASMYPLILEAAEEGDWVAQGLLMRAAEALVEAAEAVVKRLDMMETSFPVAVSGGVFGNSPTMRTAFQRLIVEKIPGARPSEPLHPPEIGALLIARDTLAREP
jgi:N-acetylglucosamine kinase-like BadF-type ATPase